MILRDAATFQVAFTYLKVKPAKRLCLLPVVLVMVLRIVLVYITETNTRRARSYSQLLSANSRHTHLTTFSRAHTTYAKVADPAKCYRETNAG